MKGSWMRRMGGGRSERERQSNQNEITKQAYFGVRWIIVFLFFDFVLIQRFTYARIESESSVELFCCFMCSDLLFLYIVFGFLSIDIFYKHAHTHPHTCPSSARRHNSVQNPLPFVSFSLLSFSVYLYLSTLMHSLT